MEYRKLKDIKLLDRNPRTIRDDDFKKLVQSIEANPDYFEARPLILSDRTGELVIIAGNQRYRAAKELKLKEVPTFLIKDLTEEREKEIIIRDNVSNGQWDWEVLANEWDSEELEAWGLDVPNKKENEEDGEILFSNELDQQNNYIVLKFSTDIDWIQAQSIFGLQSTYSKRANGKPWSKGVGRVVDGTDAIIKIKDSINEG